MSFSTLYIFVEGDDDERIVNRLLKPPLESLYNHVHVTQYSVKTKEKTENFIQSINAMTDADYIFITDIDTHMCITSKKQWVQKQLRNIDPSKIIIVVKEIESWYLAGIPDKDCRRLKIKPFAETNNITKEMFNSYIPSKFKSRIDFMSELLNCFSVEIATTKNQSFKYIITKLSLMK